MTRKPTRPNGVENDVGPPNLASASCDLDIWTPDPQSLSFSCPCATDCTCASWQQNRFIRL